MRNLIDIFSKIITFWGDVWGVFGGCLGGAWGMFGGCLGDVWGMFGGCLGMFGECLGCLGGAWGMFGGGGFIERKSKFRKSKINFLKCSADHF